MHFSLAILIPLLATTALARNVAQPAHRRHHGRHHILERAGAPYDNTTLEEISSAAAAYSATAGLTSAGSAASSASTVSAASSASDPDALTTSASSVASSSLASAVSPSMSASPTVDTATSISSAALPSSTLDTATQAVVSTISVSNAVSSAVMSTPPTTAVVTRTTAQLTTTVKKTTSGTSTATAAAASESTKSTGINKTTLIAIIVVASVVGAAAIGFTAFRKWKLKPSNRFDSRMKPIDFSPQGGRMDDDFLEKTLQRTASNSSADRQRQQFVSELDQPDVLNHNPNYVAGVPEHDFTAGANYAGAGAGAGVGAGAGYHDAETYNTDPYAHAQAYDYDAEYAQHGVVQPGHQYPPGGGQYAVAGDYAVQDPAAHGDYADLQRGNSLGSGHGHGHAQNHMPQSSFPEPFGGLGRPTGGSEGPYAQAAQYRSY